MSEKITRLMVLVALSLILLMPGPVWSESQIFMKDGRVIKVENFWREEGMVKYDTRIGIVGIPMQDVEKIVTPAVLAFEEARKLDTIKGYEAFLKDHGLSEQAVEARQRLKKLEFQEVRQMDTPSVYINYIERNPNSVFLEEARDRAETLVYEDALRSNEQKKYDTYVSLFPEGKYTAQVMGAMEALQAESLKGGSSVTDIEAFLKAYPDSTHRGDLEARIAEMAAEAEAAAQKKLEAKNRAAALEAAKAELRRKRLIQFGGIGGVLALLAAAVVVFIKISARRKAAALLLAELDDELGAEGEGEGEGAPELYQTWENGPVRYEDLLGVERKPTPESLPGVAEAKGIGVDAQAALPGPEGENPGEGETSEGEGISPFMEDVLAGGGGSVIQLGSDEGSEPAESDGEEVIDLSDHETDFKLELEDIPEEKEEGSRPRENAGPQEFDPEDLDFSEILEGSEDEAKRRRGGGRAVDR